MQKLRHSLYCAAGLFCLAASTAFAAQVNLPPPGAPDLVPTGKGWGEYDEFAPDRVEIPMLIHGQLVPSVTGYGIKYHGGPVMQGTTPVYLIWYGNWGTNTAKTLIPAFVNGLSGSAYQNINTTYLDSTGQHVANSLSVAGQVSVSSSGTYATSLSDAAIKTLVANNCAALGNCAANAIYAVLTSQDVTASSGFCTSYCGWHTHGAINGKDVKYAFVGNPARCIASCGAQSASSPNGNPGADAMVSILTHEISETLSDPDLNAWYDTAGNENADKCAWKFGTTSTAANGSKYNVVLGGKQWLVQQNWSNVSPSGKCALSYP